MQTPAIVVVGALALSCHPLARQVTLTAPPVTQTRTAASACSVGVNGVSGPDDLADILQRESCLVQALPSSAQRSLKALHVHVELDAPRVPVGGKLSGVVLYQNEGEPPLEVWLDVSRPLEQAIRIVPDATAAEGDAAPPRVVVSSPRPCDLAASPVRLLRFVVRGGERIQQRIEWAATGEGTFRVEVTPAFATCVVDPVGATLDGAYFGVPGHPG